MSAARGSDMAAYAACKRAVLGSLSGTVLEIGAGSGANFGLFAPGIDWMGLEPAPGAGRRLAVSAAVRGQHRPIIAGVAERIPLPDDSVDAVAATLVLCSVADQAAALTEVIRVLRPGGRFAFFEHVVAPAWTLSRLLQRCSAPLSRRIDGCDPARDTWRAIEAASFRAVECRWFSSRPAFGLYCHFLGGIARV